MSIGAGIALFVIGAILAFALQVTVDWLDLQLVGYIPVSYTHLTLPTNREV